MLWPTRVPGQPYLWVLDLGTGKPATNCPTHQEPLTPEGVCLTCTGIWYRALGADPHDARPCSVCRLPLHPVVIAEGFTVHPSCDFTHVPEEWT